MKSPVFANVRKDVVAALLVAAGSASLCACSSGSANYQPAPNYTQPAAQTPSYPTYAAPAHPTYTAPAPQYAAPTQPAPSKGQFACGKGMCG